MPKNKIKNIICKLFSDLITLFLKLLNNITMQISKLKMFESVVIGDECKFTRVPSGFIYTSKTDGCCCFIPSTGVYKYYDFINHINTPFDDALFANLELGKPINGRELYDKMVSIGIVHQDESMKKFYSRVRKWANQRNIALIFEGKGEFKKIRILRNE